MQPAPTLLSERLVLRTPGPDDAEALARFASENREHLAPWEPLRTEEYFSPAFWRAEIAKLQHQRLSDQGVSFVIFWRRAPDGPILGRCTLTNIVRGPFQAAHLGFALASDVVGQGVMLEALTQVIRFAFTELRLHRVMANYQPENVRSGVLLQRLGFRVEGMALDYLHLNGAWRDHVLTAVVNREWRAA